MKSVSIFRRLLAWTIGLFLLSAPALFAEDSSLDLETVLARLEGHLDWEPLSMTGVITSGIDRASFRISDSAGVSLFNGEEIMQGPQPWLESGILRFPADWVEAFEALKQRSLRETPSSHFRVQAILIDPGHGGKDPGAVATHTIDGKKQVLQEKDIVLSVARDLHARLKAAYPDKRILLTRSGDSYPSLDDRVRIANGIPLDANEAIIYVSLHCNASFNTSAQGYEVWYLSPEYRRDLVSDRNVEGNDEILPILNDMLEEEFTTESVIMARNMLHYFDLFFKGKTKSRGLKAAEWFVVRNAKMPSVLVELGFLTNEQDARLFLDESHLQRFAEALYSAISDYVRSFEQTTGGTSTP